MSVLPPARRRTLCKLLQSLLLHPALCVHMLHTCCLLLHGATSAYTAVMPSRDAQFAGVVCQCFLRGGTALAGDPPAELARSTFAQLGGDSLAALQVVGAILRQIGAVVPPEVVLTGRAAEVVQYLADKVGLAVVDEELFAKLEPQDRGWEPAQSWVVHSRL